MAMSVHHSVLWIVLLGSATLPACKNGTEPPALATLSIRDTTLLVDEQLIVPVTARDASGRLIRNPSITFTSSAPAVLSVSGPGVVTALAPGTSVLTATMDGIVAEARITVAAQFTNLAVGTTHACGITGRGEVYCWGTSFHGELGPASGIQDCSARFGPGVLCSSTPIRSSSLRPVEITAGDMHTCALVADGTAYCWGANFYGQAGTGSLSDEPVPTAVAGGHSFAHLVAGRMHTCGVTTSRAAYCWGWDWTGALGAGDVSAERCVFFSSDPCSRTPRLVVGRHEWAQLAATDRATCGVTTAGELYCWGLDVGGNDGQYCQTPDNLTGCTRTPILVRSAKAYKSTSIGNVHRCQQALDGTLECWGANYWGMFGDGTVNSSPTPITEHAPVVGAPAFQRPVKRLLAAVDIANARGLVRLRRTNENRSAGAPGEIVGRLAVLPVVASNVEPPAVKLARGRDAARRAIGRGQLRPLMTADYQPRRATARVTTEEHTALGRDITSAQRTGPIPPPAVRGTRGGDATGMHPSRDEVREAVSAGHGGGDRLVREAAGTRLAIEIRPPAIRRAIRNEGARMQVARH